MGLGYDHAIKRGNNLITRKHVLLFCGMAMASSSLAQTEGVALVGARIETGTGQTIESGTVAFKDNKIVYVGTGNAPAGFKKVDAKGMTVYPGFIDGCMTRGYKLPEVPQNPPLDVVTTAPPTMREFNRKGVWPDLDLAKNLDLKSAVGASNEAGFTCAVIANAIGTFRGQSCLVNLSGSKQVPVMIQSQVAQVTGLGTGPQSGYPSTPFAIMATYRQTMLDAQRMLQTPAADRPKVLAPLESLFPVLRGEQPLMFFADGERDISRALGLVDEFGSKAMLVGAKSGYLRLDEIKRSGLPVLANIAIGTPPTKSTDPDSLLPKDVFEERVAEWKKRSENLLKLKESGIPFAITSLGDSSSNFLTNIRRILKTGMDWKTILQSITMMPAKMFGMDKQMGSIEVGKQAYFTIANGDLSNDKVGIKYVVVAGQMRDIDAPMDEEEEAKP